MSGESGVALVKRNAAVLATAQAIVGSSASICMALGGLAGTYLLAADKTLATIPVTGYNLGVAVGAIPAAMLMRWLGRRNGLISGTAFSAAGSLIATSGLLNNNFWLFAFGLLVIGCGAAFVQQYRFAASDGVTGDFKAKAISYVMIGGIFSAIIGPQIVIFTRDLMAPVMFAGAFASITVLAVIGAAVLTLFRSPAAPEKKAKQFDAPARPLSEIFFQRQFFTAFVCAVISFSTMTFVMTGSPIAMIGCGFTTDDAALGISAHILAMFGPSFFTGSLIARFGKRTIVATGMVCLLLSAMVGLSGVSLWQFWVTLILLGVGWNFGFIGATALLSDCYYPEEKSKVEAAHDFTLFSFVAFGSLMAGVVYNALGWDGINLVVMPFICFALFLLLSGKTSEAVARA